MEWININNGLPIEEKNYLVARKWIGINFIEIALCTSDFGRNKRFEISHEKTGEGIDITESITHYMNLPSFPEL